MKLNIFEISFIPVLDSFIEHVMGKALWNYFKQEVKTLLPLHIVLAVNLEQYLQEE